MGPGDDVQLSGSQIAAEVLATMSDDSARSRPSGVLLEVGRLAPVEIRTAQNLRVGFDLDGDLLVPADHERDRRIALDVGVLARPSRTIEDGVPGFGGVWIYGFWCLTSGGSDGTSGLRVGVPPEGTRPARRGPQCHSVARDLDVSDQTIYNWRRQDRIDRGIQPGLSTAEKAELSEAKKRIAELETELDIAQNAVDLLKEETSPKAGTRRSR